MAALAAVLMALTAAASVRAVEPKGDDAMVGLLEFRCVDCHDDVTTKADFRFDKLIASPDFERDFVKWEHVLTRLVDRSMPPKKAKDRPTEAEYESAIAWLRGKMIVVEQRRAENKPRWMRRLNRAEYDNTVRDLFGVEGLRPAETLPVDDALHGFDNVAEGLTVSPLHMQGYLDAAYAVLDEVIVTGEKPEPRTVRHTFNFYGEKVGDGQLRVRDGNSVLSVKKGDKHWVGGPLHMRLGVAHAGTYRVTVRGKAHQFNGTLAGFVTTVNRRDPRDWDTTPVDGRMQDLITFDTRLDADGEAIIEVQWTENQHRLGEKRAGTSESDSPFRQLQRAKKTHKDDLVACFAELSWPYFTDVEIEVAGPLHETWPPAATQRLLGPSRGESTFEPILAAFLPRAFRRPVSDDEVRRYVSIAQAELDAGEPYVEALKHALAAAMVSPHFLFLVETPEPDTPRGGHTLGDFELASRLSYFLWSSMPDDELLAAARAGKLRDPAELRRQVDRLLGDPKARALTDGFAEQWLSVRRIPSLMPEPTLFRSQFDDYIHAAIAREPLAFFDVVRTEDRSVVEFLDADWTVVNATLARFYGFEGVEGQTFRKVRIDDPRRGGIVTQAGYLTLTSEATRTSPVKRGIWVLEHLFHRPPPPPPPNVGTLIAENDDEPKPIHARCRARSAGSAGWSGWCCVSSRNSRIAADSNSTASPTLRTGVRPSGESARNQPGLFARSTVTRSCATPFSESAMAMRWT